MTTAFTIKVVVYQHIERPVTSHSAAHVFPPLPIGFRCNEHACDHGPSSLRFLDQVSKIVSLGDCSLKHALRIAISCHSKAIAELYIRTNAGRYFGTRSRAQIWLSGFHTQ